MGKTDRCLYTRITQHSYHDSSEIYNHISSCNEFNFIKNLLELSPYDEDSNTKCSLTDLIFTNTKIIDKSKLRFLILCQESIAINRSKPSLNHGTKASRDLLMDHSPIRQTFKFENNFSTVGKSFLNLGKL